MTLIDHRYLFFLAGFEESVTACRLCFRMLDSESQEHQETICTVIVSQSQTELGMLLRVSNPERFSSPTRGKER